MSTHRIGLVDLSKAITRWRQWKHNLYFAFLFIVVTCSINLLVCKTIRNSLPKIHKVNSFRNSIIILWHNKFRCRRGVYTERSITMSLALLISNNIKHFVIEDSKSRNFNEQMSENLQRKKRLNAVKLDSFYFKTFYSHINIQKKNRLYGCFKCFLTYSSIVKLKLIPILFFFAL